MFRLIRGLASLIPWAIVLIPAWAAAQVDAPTIGLPEMSIKIGGGDGNLVESLKVMGMLTILTLAPAIVISVTSFTRIIIVFGFLRTALGTQSSPPNQVLVSLALFLTAAVMTPVASKIWTDGIEPHQNGQISDVALLGVAAENIRGFLLLHVRDQELMTVHRLAAQARPRDRSEIAFHLLIPAFMLSELKAAFQIGFLVALPFLVVDLAVATLLMSMGMMMLPPVMVSLPFKVLIFLMADGWNLVVINLARSFGLAV
jgi:flagellar biosynthetic protein FliP